MFIQRYYKRKKCSAASSGEKGWGKEEAIAKWRVSGNQSGDSALDQSQECRGAVVVDTAL